MKRLQTIALLVLLMNVVTLVPVMAQRHIMQQIEELEKKGTMSDQVVRRDPKTKKIGAIVKSFKFYSRSAGVADDLRNAFIKDAPDATNQVTKNSSPTIYAENYSCTLIFAEGTKKTIYVLKIVGSKYCPSVTLSMIYKDSSVNIDESSIDTDDIDESSIDIDDIDEYTMRSKTSSGTYTVDSVYVDPSHRMTIEYSHSN